MYLHLINVCLMLDQWGNMNKYHKKLKSEKINKTSNPKLYRTECLLVWTGKMVT